MGVKRTHPSQAGFALIGVLAALPLILALLAGLGLTAIALKNRTEIFAQCRAEVWNAQKDMSQLLKNLISLNPRAKRLRAQRKAAEAEVKAAKLTFNPAIIAAAEAHRAIVLGQQMHLRAEQERLLFQALTRRARAQERVRGFIKNRDGRLEKIVSPSASLAVRKSPPNDLTPDYIGVEDFSSEQRLQAHWEGQLFHGAPPWLLNAGPLSNLKFRGECSATIKQEKKSWHPQLLAAKSLPK